LDYTQYFKDREQSTRILEEALMGRSKTLGFVPPEGFEENMKKLKKELQELRDKHDFDDPLPQEFKEKPVCNT
jgi:hypothetical protein